eukprot:c19746_g3_i1.p1 GENE.c19746_g3_i1~~c19746_g3_i1.p1  ORF type:complete len:448 (+),score=136.89 c19746_g3_i1:25-1344(+)
MDAIDIFAETKPQMDHAKARKIIQKDTSIDEPWEYSKKDEFVDKYVHAVLKIVFFPKLLIMYPIAFLLMLIPTSIAHIYVTAITDKDGFLDHIPRSCSFYIISSVIILLALPVFFVIALSLMLDYFFFFFFGSIYCTFSCRWSNYRRSHEAIAPYRNGPPLLFHIFDIIVASMGMSYRQGYFEFISKFTIMFFLCPWIKYWVVGNEFLFDLGERFITQISAGMPDMTPEQVRDGTLRCISTLENQQTLREQIDQAFFSPHYPFPPPGRCYALGMQQAKKTATIVHTTHLYSAEQDKSLPNNLPEPFVFSNSAKIPIYRVMLWYNNPFHVFTGYVEANISNGSPSQLDRDNGVEHPMWLVCGHNRSSADRSSTFSVGYIDKFFDRFLPLLVFMIRSTTLGKEVAIRRHKELLESKDGQSTLKPAVEEPQPIVVQPIVAQP